MSLGNAFIAAGRARDSACDHCGAPAGGSKGKAVISMGHNAHRARLCLACYNNWEVYGPHYTERVQWP